MKQFFYTSLLTLFSFCAYSQNSQFTGIWEGDLDAGVQKLRLVFTVSAAQAGVKLSMQSPQQSAREMPADTAFISGNLLNMEMKKFRISFSGRLLNDSTIAGEFVQGAAFPLRLKKVEKASLVTQPKRPQTPKPPFAYQSIDVSFINKDKSATLAGTLTLPDTMAGKKFPAVILITGSGAQDRDETMFGHKPFFVIADHLTKKGFAVLRIDDRGTARSTGNHATATSADFALDTESALDYLKQHASIDAKNIGLVGHSEGGQIAPMVAARRKDVKFIVLLAGPGIPIIDLMAGQNVAIFESNGLDTATAKLYAPLFKKLVRTIVVAKDSAAALNNAINVLKEWEAPAMAKTLFKVSTDEEIKKFAKGMADGIYNPWFRYFISYDPAPVLEKLSCAVLALNGSKDLQVLPAANLAGIKNALQKSKAKNYEVKEIPQLNHLFQTCKRCGIDEYSTLEESFSPLAMEIMSNWIQVQVK